MNDIYTQEKKYLEKVNAEIDIQTKDTEEKHHTISIEKLSGEDRLRGHYLHNNAIMNVLYHSAKKLKSVANSPYFGRMDFTENNEDSQNLLSMFQPESKKSEIIRPLKLFKFRLIFNKLARELLYCDEKTKARDASSCKRQWVEAIIENVKQNKYGNCYEFSFLVSDILTNLGIQNKVLYMTNDDETLKHLAVAYKNAENDVVVADLANANNFLKDPRWRIYPLFLYWKIIKNGCGKTAYCNVLETISHNGRNFIFNPLDQYSEYHDSQKKWDLAYNKDSEKKIK